jgi:endonuclease YncB( thermonuclease family)
MVRLLREMLREVVMLPLAIKFIVAISISALFIVITQWEHLGLDTQWARLTQRHAVLSTPKIAIAPQHSEQQPIKAAAPPKDEARAPGVEPNLLSRIDRSVIVNPKVQPNGSIIGNGQTFLLYGTKQFDRNKICAGASGPWACGLHAYAALRNAIAEKTIVCEPRRVLQNAISAVCHIGTTDLSQMLIREGLAELDSDSDSEYLELEKAQAFAKSQKSGIWNR